MGYSAITLTSYLVPKRTDKTFSLGKKISFTVRIVLY